ncbi:MAG: DUF362 domain-containing protein [Candidatus Omnitrophica bacterium]|nr:DUF362 domain-containing protein [Candidatus Omnitrophota bacterium]
MTQGFGDTPPHRMSRRQFMKWCASGLAFVSLQKNFWAQPADAYGRADSAPARPRKKIRGAYDLVVAKGNDPYRQTVEAVAAMGGIGRFVAKNSVVVIKPNIGWDRTPEQACNTNPQVVAALIDICRQAGAKRVNIFDRTCNDSRRCYTNSGIERIAQKHGAQIFFPNDWNVLTARFPYESGMQGWPIYREALECDTFINVPVAKHHGLTKLTLSMKNLMGVCGGNRGMMHVDIGPKLVDLTDFIGPDLTVIDAYRVLVRHGPQGGSLEDVEEPKTIIVGTDPVLADSYAAQLFGSRPEEIPYLKASRERKFGSVDITAAALHEITV